MSSNSVESLIARIDWDRTALGPRECWPPALQTALGICLGAHVPAIVYWGPHFVALYNAPAAAMFGTHHSDALGQPAARSWPALWALLEHQLAGVRASGTPAVVANWQVPTPPGGARTEAYFTVSLSPIEDGAGIGGVFCLMVETTDSVLRERETRSRAIEREFMSEASRLLAESLDLPTTLQNIARLTIPQFADWCQVDIRTPDDQIETVAIAHHDRKKNEIAQRFVGRIHFDPKAEAGQAYAIRTGRSHFVESLELSMLEATVDDEYEVRMYQQLGIRSFVSVPLIAQGATLGALAVIYGDSGRHYVEDDLPLLEELGRRAGLAVQNANEFEREHRVAQSFQEASLPAELPAVPGVRFDAVYVPASDEAQIGGDWYDAVRLFDGRIVISIGDVAGKGLHAAVTMGNMRQIIRGIAQVHADPALILDAADRALRLEAPGQFVTAFVGVLDPIVKTFAYASAGHPPPLMQFRDGRVEALTDGGLPLGLRLGREDAVGRIIDASAATRLVLYTDGLTEVFHRPLDGEQQLRTLLDDEMIFAAEHPARALKEAFFDGARAKDDVAILIVGIESFPDAHAAVPAIQQWTFDAHEETAARAARHEIGETILARGGALEDVYAAELVFGELVGNAVRHAPGRVEVTVDWSASAPVLHVMDRGPGFRHAPILPDDPYSEYGRGLFLISTLTDDFHVSRRPSGGSHARAVLSLRRARLAAAGPNVASLFEGVSGLG
ncbi:MAG: SpoIIE family protein phosphatase [Candidatus Velthaea sp.]